MGWLKLGAGAGVGLGWVWMLGLGPGAGVGAGWAKNSMSRKCWHVYRQNANFTVRFELLARMMLILRDVLTYLRIQI